MFSDKRPVPGFELQCSILSLSLYIVHTDAGSCMKCCGAARNHREIAAKGGRGPTWSYWKCAAHLA